jgi:hypothetical protein
VLAKLSDLDRERQSLEGRLAQYNGVLSELDLNKVELQPKDIQNRRISFLSDLSSRPSSVVSVFVSYSHVHESLRKELGKHLRVLERQAIIESWHDRMKRALERHEDRQALVIPIMLRPVSLKGTPFAKLQALPKDAKPVVTWADRDSAVC